MVHYQTHVEEDALLKAKQGVQLNYAQRIGNVAQECALVLVYQEITDTPNKDAVCITGI